jgi:hypothetical protein
MTKLATTNVCTSSSRLNQWPKSAVFTGEDDRSLVPSPRPRLEKFYKGGSQEKTRLRRPEFFLLPSPRDRARSVRTYRATCSVCKAQGPSDWGFFYQRFSSTVATKPSVLKLAKQNGGQVPTMVLSETRGLWLFRVVREGLGSAVRLGARGTQRLTFQLRLALEPECLENPMATAREDPRDGADSVGDTQAACGFRY